ncbi:hypothetical protein AAF712_004823 [Marasmius tenuissimus]|uniref:Uncharacterized protein n=1 Tax=Marasmius tenuissimus TaxID=585030 RepID=A0ABR3A594_9AGAR
MADPLPYNLTIPSQTASLIYSPARGPRTKASDGWELAYPAVDSIGYQRQGRGADFHNTTRAEASITFGWLGTAIYVYGTGTRESYSFSVDGQNVGQTFDVLQGGLLGSMTGMQYKEHNATLKVVGGEMVAFQYADLTIGLGYPGEEIRNSTIEAVLGVDQPNPYFDFKNDSSGWAPESGIATITFPNGTASPVTRQMATEGRNDSLRFNVTSAGAFILWGSLYEDHPVKRITISPKPGSSDPTSIKETFMHDTGQLGEFQQILYWESGLERGTSYTVDISAVADQQKLAFNELQLLDGGSPSPPSSTPEPSPSAMNGIEGHHRHLTSGNIAVIIIVPILFLAAVGVGAFWARKTQTPAVTPYVGIFKNLFSSKPPSTSSSTVTSPSNSTAACGRPSREVDAGPLPPQYNPLWADPPGDGNTTSNSALGAVQNGARKWRKFTHL